MTEQASAPRQLSRTAVKRLRKREQARQAQRAAHADMEALILIADRAKDQSMYWISNKIFRYLIKRYFAILRKERLIFIESHRDSGIAIPPGIHSKIGLVKGDGISFKLRSVGKICNLPLDMQEAWHLLCTSFDGPDLAVLKSPISDASICIPVPRLEPNKRALMYAFGKRIPRHTSTRVTSNDPEQQLQILKDLAASRTRLPQ
jgi:hypothetical protein